MPRKQEKQVLRRERCVEVGMTAVIMAMLPLSFLYAARPDSVARISQITGEVQIKAADSAVWSKAKKGDVIKPGVQIKTELGSRAIIETKTSDRLQLFQKTTVELKEVTTQQTRIKVLIGRLRSLVKYLKQRKNYQVQTPLAVASVRGTEFDTVVEEDGKSVFEVYKGIVGVKDLEGIGEEVSLFKNQRTTIERGGAPTPPENFGREMRGMFKERRETDKGKELARLEARRENAIDKIKEHLQANVTLEQRLSEYQDGKTIINAFGERVRIEEYIVRPQPNQFSFVTINTTPERISFSRYDAFARDRLPDKLTDIDNLFRRIGNDTASNYIEKQKWFVSNGGDIYREWSEGGLMVFFPSANLSQVVFQNWYVELKGAAAPNFRLVSHWVPHADFLSGSKTSTTSENIGTDGALDIPDGYSNFESATDVGAAVGDTRLIDTSGASFESRLLNSTIFGNSNYQASEGYTRTSHAEFDGVKLSNLGTPDAKLAAIYNAKIVSAVHEYKDGSGTKVADLRLDQYKIDDNGGRLSLLDIDRLRISRDAVNFEYVGISTDFRGKLDLVLTPRIFRKAGLID